MSGSWPRRLGVRPSKRLGQNFVIEPGTVRKIAALAALRPDDVVLEVGPGLGSLTLALLDAGPGQVVAIEIDRALAREAAAHDRRAARRIWRAGWPWSPPTRCSVAEPDLPRSAPSVLVANLPYNVAVPVVLHLLAALPSLAGGAGHGPGRGGGPDVRRTRVTGVRRAVGEAGLVRGGRAWPGPVPRTVFWPVPNVDSRLVAFTRRDPPAAAGGREEVFAVIDAAFGQRRKTLRAALAGWAGSAPEAERLLRAAGHRSGRARGIARSVAEFARLAAVHRAEPRTICTIVTRCDACGCPPNLTSSSRWGRRALTATTAW